MISPLWVCLDCAYCCWNWKYCNKIIFKYVNSVVGPIYNEKVVEKWNLWIYKQCTNTLFTEDLVKCCSWIKKKKKQNAEEKCTATFSALQTGTMIPAHCCNTVFFLIDGCIKVDFQKRRQWRIPKPTSVRYHTYKFPSSYIINIYFINLTN